MSKDRRHFERRQTDTWAALATAEGQDLDAKARVLDLSVNGIRLSTAATLIPDNRYRVKLANTDTWFDILVLVHDRESEQYRCRIETSWDDLQEVIHQSDDLLLLVLGSSTDGKSPD